MHLQEIQTKRAKMQLKTFHIATLENPSSGKYVLENSFCLISVNQFPVSRIQNFLLWISWLPLAFSRLCVLSLTLLIRSKMLVFDFVCVFLCVCESDAQLYFEPLVLKLMLLLSNCSNLKKWLTNGFFGRFFLLIVDLLGIYHSWHPWRFRFQYQSCCHRPRSRRCQTFFLAMCIDHIVWKNIEMVLMLLFLCPRFFRSNFFGFAFRAGVDGYDTRTRCVHMGGSNWKTKNWYKRMASRHR